MSKKILVLTTLLALVVLGGWGCGKKSAEKTAEKIIEESAGGDVDVDIDDESVTITDRNTNSTATYGQNKLPDDWPSDVPVYDGTIITTSSSNNEDGDYFSASVQTDDSIDEVYSYYEDELADEGWTVASTMTVNQTKYLSASKGESNVSVTIGLNDEEDKTTFSIIVSVENDDEEEEGDEGDESEENEASEE